MRHLLPVLAVSVLAVSCVEAPGADVDVFPSAIAFDDWPGAENRHTYEITGPTWNTEHRVIRDVVWTAPLRPRTDGFGVLEPQVDEPAPYTAGTPMVIRARFDAALAPQVDTHADIRATGTLRSTTDPALGPLEVVHYRGEIRREDGVFEEVEMHSAPLPDRVDVWELTIHWTVSSDDDEQTFRTKHTVPTTWRQPIDGAPLYKRLILWSSAWAAGSWPDSGAETPETLDSEHEITTRLLHGTRALEDEGRSYGRFPRPERRSIRDRADVWLDFSQSACGEWRGALMALVETQGIDASWVWFKFPDPDDEDDEEFWHPGVYTHYRTREISAVGRNPKRWINTNHIVVNVNGRIYDPTYTVIKDSWEAYEDFMFVEYCKTDGAKPSDSECVPNPTGYTDDDVHPRVIFADNYR